MEMVAQLFAASYLMSIGSVDGRYGAANELTAPPESPFAAIVRDCPYRPRREARVRRASRRAVAAMTAGLPRGIRGMTHLTS